MLRTARHIHRETGLRNLCLAGGVALNCVANGRLQREGPYENLWIQPAAGDAGGAVGAALAAYHQHLGRPRLATEALDGMRGAYLGPEFDDDDAARRLTAVGARFQRFGAVGARDPRIELARLRRGAADEFGAADARGEAEVVLDPARRSRLPADGGALEYQGVEPL